MLKDKEFDLSIPSDKESFKRSICKLATNGESVSKNMIKLGAAWADTFEGGNPELVAEDALAKAHKAGLFANPNAENPRVYRKRYEHSVK